MQRKMRNGLGTCFWELTSLPKLVGTLLLDRGGICLFLNHEVLYLFMSACYASNGYRSCSGRIEDGGCLVFIHVSCLLVFPSSTP